MKKFLKFTILLCCAGMLMQTSCKKDDSDENPEFSGACYMTNLGPTRIIYHSTNKIKYLIDLYGTEYADTIFAFNYNTQGRINVIDYMLGWSPTERDSVFYDSDDRVAYIKKYIDEVYAGRGDYHYNSANQIIAIDLTGNMNTKHVFNVPLENVTVTYEYDDNGNVRKELKTSGRSIISGKEFEYDNMRNPYREWNLPIALGKISLSKIMSQNNYTKEKRYSSGATITTASYTYNSNGYPITMVITDEDGSETWGIQYYCIQ